ncbi:Hypothetical Protein FCC1311_021852 [Hondaea fermentalgiana]|uniref:Uncharacterized protein n=1 Tax=Hondaea fermentalgiana TaxID=2315210 RepID=A0A2R5G606_9STRA|nr:Hypothetical Protein FCC1311_021852 [Hondaea fermentalgiana]|eukprot:GBG25965.1 Hypothetical Protein FCC1311_021852 [Hondaea fermentalgiana]
MESQIERLLTVLMNKVVDGIPDGKGGYLERPLETEAKRFVNDCGGELDAAVAAAAHFIFVRKPSWSESMWRSALIVVVGQVPLVGSTAAIFYNQFESVWRQLRFVALAATIYGHDVRDDATQCQVILCLLDDNIRKRQGPGAMDKIYKKLGKNGVQVAATVIARQVVARGGTSFLMKKVLGGLLIGVVPEAVGLLYTAFFTDTFMSNDAEKAVRAKQLKERARSHFKKDAQPTLVVAWVSFLVWFVPILTINVSKVWVVFDRILMRLLTTGPVQPALLSHPIVDSYIFGTFDASRESWPAWLTRTVCFSLFVSFKAALLCFVALMAVYFAHQIGRRQTWMVSTAALGIRAALNFLSARNTALSLALAIEHVVASTPHDGLYHGHRAFVGFFAIISRSRTELKPYNPWVVGSLLLWIGYHCLIVAYTYSSAIIYALAPLLFVGEDYDWQIAFADSTSVFKNVSSSAFAMARLGDALNALTTIALHVLIEEIRKPDIVMTLVGPKKVVEGILYAAKSLGNVVSSPDSVLFWLDKTTPPVDVSWALLSLQFGATGLGLFWGLVTHFHWLSPFEAFLVTANVLQFIPKLLWRKSLPPPHETQVWNQALESRHRLLYLIPDINSGLRSKVYDAVTFFEHYEFAVNRSQEYASSSFVRVKDWVQSSFTKREQQEFERLGSSSDLLEDSAGQPLEFDVGVYYDENDTWFARIKGALSFRGRGADGSKDSKETLPLDTVVESDGLGHLRLLDGQSVDEADANAIVPHHSWKEWFHVKFTAVLPWKKADPAASNSNVEITELDSDSMPEMDGTTLSSGTSSDGTKVDETSAESRPEEVLETDNDDNGRGDDEDDEEEEDKVSSQEQEKSTSEDAPAEVAMNQGASDVSPTDDSTTNDTVPNEASDAATLHANDSHDRTTSDTSAIDTSQPIVEEIEPLEPVSSQEEISNAVADGTSVTSTQDEDPPSSQENQKVEEIEESKSPPTEAAEVPSSSWRPWRWRNTTKDNNSVKAEVVSEDAGKSDSGATDTSDNAADKEAVAEEDKTEAQVDADEEAKKPLAKDDENIIKEDQASGSVPEEEKSWIKRWWQGKPTAQDV